MRTFRKIFRIWFGVVAAFCLGVILFDHTPTEIPVLLTCFVQTLLALISYVIYRSEPVQKNRIIFLNFALFFAVSLLGELAPFVGRAFLQDVKYARHLYNQYFVYGAYAFLLGLSVVYLSVDALFRDFKIFHKYLIALAIVAGFFGYYYHPFFRDPMYAYATADIEDWRVLDKAVRTYQTENGGASPTVEQLIDRTEMFVWKNGQAVGMLYPEERAARIREIAPYLEGDNWRVLLAKPIYMNHIYMNVLCIGFILLFFGYQYMKDPPQGAYIEKIMFLLLVFCSIEILHAWSVVKAVEWSALADIMGVGAYVSIAILALIGVFLGLRLRFIQSVKGEFYEQQLAASANAITRWRDTIDNIIIDSFMNRRLLIGRMFVNPHNKTGKEHIDLH